MFDGKLKFSFHVNNIAADGNKMVGLLRRTVILNNTTFFKICLTSERGAPGTVPYYGKSGPIVIALRP